MRKEIADFSKACPSMRSLSKIEIKAVKVINPALPTEKALGTQA
jgi:hypothetical protein